MFSYIRKSRSALNRITDLLTTTGDPDWSSIFDRADKQSYLITFCNPLSIQTALKHTNYTQLLEKFDYIYADGILLARYASRYTNRVIYRRSFDGNSLGADILKLTASAHQSVALIGGVDGVTTKATAVLQDIGINVVYHRSGYFTDNNEKLACFKEISSSGAKIVIVGMGCPYQEDFLVELVKAGWIGVGFTCGGYLDQISIGNVEYYPEVINKLHLRAIYRALHEPRRLIPRYTIHYFPFYLSAIMGLISSKR